VTAPVKILFDECVSDVAMNEIARVVSLSSAGCEFRHIKDYLMQGIHDDVWVPEIAREKCWIVLSGDRGKQSKTSKSKNFKGEKLRTVCKKYEVTLVELSQKIHHLPTREKIAAILNAWPALVEVTNAPLGSRHLLRFSGIKSLRPIVIQVDPPGPLTEIKNLVDKALKDA
jgi:PIN like domain